MTPVDESAPAFFGRWRNIYLTVLVGLAVDIGLLYAFTVRFR